MSILFYCNFPNQKKWITSIKNKFVDQKIYTINQKFNYEKIDYLIIWNLPEKIFSRFKNLKIIFSLGAGIDHIINLPSYKNIPIVRLKDPIMALRMSNHVLSQVLNYQLKLQYYQRSQTTKTWLGEKETLLNHEIRIGILGCGFLGERVGKLLKKLKYQVIGFKNSNKKTTKSFPIYIKPYLKKFIKECDIIVVILPFTTATKNFINYSFLKKMKKKSLLINVGRGQTVNEKDLVRHLKTNDDFFASLDVFQKEPLSTSNELWTLPNVTITHHIAAITDIDSAVNQMYIRYLNYKKTGKIKSDLKIKKGY